MINKKIFIGLIIFSIMFGNFFLIEKNFASTYVKGEENLDNCRDQKFLITAYYSPLPGQRFYMRGDYAADIRLNGQGTNGADGTAVYMGLLAGPRGYKFGQKIVLPGLGIGTIHDRGGAILAKSRYHRIDIWMGRGESGLARALNWGIQFIDGKACSKSPELDTLSFLGTSGKLPGYVERKLIKRTNNLKNGGTYTFKGSGVGGKKITIGGKYSGKKSYKKNIKKYIKKEQIFKFVKIPHDIGFGDEGQNVLRLQIIMKNIGFYRENPNGVYDNATMEAVFNFQREEGVVENLDVVGAGHFGKNTKKSLENFLIKMYEKSKKNVGIIESKIIYSKNSEKTKIKSSAPKAISRLKKQYGSKISVKGKSKQMIFSFSKTITVKQIQELLKQGKKVDSFNKINDEKNEKEIKEDIS